MNSVVSRYLKCYRCITVEGTLKIKVHVFSIGEWTAAQDFSVHFKYVLNLYTRPMVRNYEDCEFFFSKGGFFLRPLAHSFFYELQASTVA